MNRFDQPHPISRPALAGLLAVLASTACADPSDPASSSTADDSTTADPGDEDTLAPFARACARLHGECASVCDNPLIECYPDVATCSEQWQADHLADYDFPQIDPVLAEECADQVDLQPCTDLQPDTAACDFAVVESCPDDTDEWGPIHTPFAAPPIELEQELQLHLCGVVEEYFAVTLTAGVEVDLVELDDGPSLFGEILRLSTNPAGDTVIEYITLPTTVPVTGEYVLGIEAADRSDRRVVLAPTPENG